MRSAAAGQTPKADSHSNPFLGRVTLAVVVPLAAIATRAGRRKRVQAKAVHTMPAQQTTAPSVADSVMPAYLAVPTAGELRTLFAKQVCASTNMEAPMEWSPELEHAFSSCKEVIKEHSETYYLATELLAPAEKRAVWAIYAWCRALDDYVDEPSKVLSMDDLQGWDDRLRDTFELRGSRYLNDRALANSARHFALIRRPFSDMVCGMAMDLIKDRYDTFEELEVYCYRVAGTVGLMTLPVLGLDAARNSTEAEEEQTIEAALSLGLAFQLTNILRDVGEDARRGRIYLPLEDLRRFHISPEELLKAGSPQEGEDLPLYQDGRWRDLMEFQIQRCQKYYDISEAGILGLSESSQLGVMAALRFYQGILDSIRENEYNNLTQRAFVPMHEKALLVGEAWFRLFDLRGAAAACAAASDHAAVRTSIERTVLANAWRAASASA